MSAVCRGCGNSKLRSESAILKTSFPSKICPWLHIWATRNMTGMSTKKAINLGLRKFSFNEIRYNQWKVVKAYAWMIAPTSFGKSLVFDHLNLSLAFLPAPRWHGLPLFALTTTKTASWFRGSFQTKLSLFLAQFLQMISDKQLSLSSFAPRRISKFIPTRDSIP